MGRNRFPWRCVVISPLLAAAAVGVGRFAVAQAAPPPAARDLVLSNWEEGRWALYPGDTMEHNVGKSPAGEPLTRIHLQTADIEQDALTLVNVPTTATKLTMFLHATPLGSGKHVAEFQDSHGWGGGGQLIWGLSGDTTYETPIAFGSWRVGFYNSKITPPYRFRGFQFQGHDAKTAAGRPVTVEAGPVHVEYTPDDQQWLYTDMQPKVISMGNGVLPPMTLRVANLGTTPHTFRLSMQPVERSLMPMKEAAASLGTLTLKPGELKAIPVKLPVHTLGWWKVEYRAESAAAGESAAPMTTQENLSVVNAYDGAEGFRRRAAARTWFSVPGRRPGTVKTDKGDKAQVTITTVSNGISPVQIFPVGARVPHHDMTLAAAMKTKAVAGSALTVLNDQLSPAWLVRSSDSTLNLFANMQAQGEGAPSHIAFATAQGTRVLKTGDRLSAAALQAMSQPWLLAWWQGNDGWKTFDIPYLVMLQHKPTALSLGAGGLSLSFAGPAGYLSSMPLYGYAKLPQESAWRAHPEQFKFPSLWTAEATHPWMWAASLPPAVVARCNWWARAMVRIPYNVHETYAINHRSGSVDVHDSFDYVDVPNDWKTPARTLAPISPSLAVAMKGGFPATVQGTVTDCQYPTIFGPYSAVEGATQVDYSLNVGPYWMQAADPNLTRPADENTPARHAQAQLLAWGIGAEQGLDSQMWDWNDGNFVWYAQGEANRDPANAIGYTPPGPFRQDQKYWQQPRTSYTLLNGKRYGMDERSGTLTRRYLDGPGIGNFGAGDWGDSGKLGNDMVLDAYDYAYHTGDYQTIADKWDVVTSLASLPTSQTWVTMGRDAISELGDQAPTMLALARMAYAVGDKQEYTAAVYWWAHELIAHTIKEGALTTWRNNFQPWNSLKESPVATGTNLWGTNAGWVDGGFRLGDGQWNQFPTRLDDPDTFRFMQKYCTTLPRMNLSLSTLAERKGDEHDNPSKVNAHGGPDAYPLYFDRVALLHDDPARAQADFNQNDQYVPVPDNYALRLTTAWHEFPAKMETLIPTTAPTMKDDGFAWDQSNQAGYGLVSQNNMPARKLPTPQWFWWNSPTAQQGAEWGDKWTFGSVSPGGGKVPTAIAGQNLNAESTLFSWDLRPATPLDRFPPAMADLVTKAKLSAADQTTLANAWDQQAIVPVLAAGPFANPGGGLNTSLAHAPEAAYLAGTLKSADVYTDNAATATLAAADWKGGGQVSWTKTDLNGGSLDFMHLWPQAANMSNDAAYVLTWVKSPKDMPVMLGTGSDDGLKIWVNSKVVFDHPASRGVKFDDDHVNTMLKAGWNSVLMKVTNGDGGWALAFRMADPNGLPIPGLAFSNEPRL